MSELEGPSEHKILEVEITLKHRMLELGGILENKNNDHTNNNTNVLIMWPFKVSRLLCFSQGGRSHVCCYHHFTDEELRGNGLLKVTELGSCWQTHSLKPFSSAMLLSTVTCGINLSLPLAVTRAALAKGWAGWIIQSCWAVRREISSQPQLVIRQIMESWGWRNPLQGYI